MRRVILAGLVLFLLAPGAAEATWSGQNGKIYFSCHMAGQGFESVDVCSVDPDGSGFANLTQSIGVAELTPSVSRDGTKISFNRADGGETRLWTANADGTNPQQVVDINADGSSWTVDGRLAFRTPVLPSGYEFRTIFPTGQGAEFLAPALSSYTPPQYGGDGTAWAYSKPTPVPPLNQTYLGQIYSVWDGEEFQVTESKPDVNAGSPSWSPDGARIYYGRTDGERDVYWSPAKGGPDSEVRVTQTATWDENRPSPSPDGTRLVYDRKERVSPTNYDIVISNIDGSGATPVDLPGVDRAYDPTWASQPAGPPPPPPKPGASAKAPKTLRIGKALTVTLGCSGNTECNFTSRGTVTVPRKKGKKKFAVAPKKTKVASGKTGKVKLRLPAKANRAAKAALKAKRKPILDLVVTARDQDGKLIKTIRLKARLKK